MDRRTFLRGLACSSLGLAGCGYFRIDPMHVLIRSDTILSLDEEAAILKKAKVSRTTDGRITVLYTRGTPYERGYQHGVLLRDEVQENLTALYDGLKARYHFEELFYEAFERMRPFIPEEYMEEMHGLAHGARLPINLVHAVHAIPSISEWGGKKHLKDVVEKMMDGSLGTSCSNFAFKGKSSADGRMYAVRVLDWGIYKLSKLHKYPLIQVGVPDKGLAFANIGWVGFIGAVSGMNAAGITLGEKGYGDPEGETLRGEPMPFMLRDVLSQAHNLRDVERIIRTSKGDCSYVFLMSDGKTGEAELFIKDAHRFKVFKPGEPVRDGKKNLPAIPEIVWDGHYEEALASELTTRSGHLEPSVIMSEMVPKIAMPGNFQNVIYEPGRLQFWVNNAKSPKERAAEQPFTFFNFGAELAAFEGKVAGRP
jgi:isopenicillin-N N-acyltransferase-like protein